MLVGEIRWLIDPATDVGSGRALIPERGRGYDNRLATIICIGPHMNVTPSSSEPALSGNSAAQASARRGLEEDKVVVYDYYTFLADADALTPVRSARPATLQLIQDLSAVPIPGSLRHAEPHEICALGFFRGALEGDKRV
jgi:hypothetical protein